MAKKPDKRILAKAKEVTAKRPKTVIDHIIKHGFITTEDLENYGYKHPPRAARDVREQGIPLVTFRVKASDGRSIGAYRFGDPEDIKDNKLGGRKVFSKEFKRSLLEVQSSKCLICDTKFEERYLQIDHRVPYEVAGESQNDGSSTEAFMLICGTCNRKKSWSCEHCDNWKKKQELATCNSCYWATPEDYEHIAQRKMKRVDLVFDESLTELLELIESDPDLPNLSISERIIEAIKAKYSK